MAKYIDYEALMRTIDETVVFTVREGTKLPTAEMRGANKVIDRIKSAPAADVVEVKHGYFKETTEPLGARDVSCVECSVCGDSWIIEEDYSIEDYEMYWHYCPNCGAKMDKRSEDGV